VIEAQRERERESASLVHTALCTFSAPTKLFSSNLC